MWDKSAHLTPTERRLLDCLVRNEGRIVSHGELLEGIGHPNSRRGRHILTQNVSLVRKKLEMDPALPTVIITHHSQGYSFAGKEEARWFPELEP